MKIIEVEGNLFDYRGTHALVHCVSSDFEFYNHCKIFVVGFL